VTAERLAQLIAKDEVACSICHENLRDQDYAYILDNDDRVHSLCWINYCDEDGRLINFYKNPKPRRYQYQNMYRQLNNMSNARY
jgi:hypothetical protein